MFQKRELFRLATTKAAAVPSHGERWKLIVPAAPAIAALVAVAFYFHRPPKLTGKDTIVLADFANSTGDAIFDDTLKDALGVALRQSPFLDIASDEKVTATLRLMMRAIELDPNFAHTYSSAGIMYLGLGDPARGKEYITKAYALRERASAYESLLMQADYYDYVLGELYRGTAWLVMYSSMDRSGPM